MGIINYSAPLTLLTIARGQLSATPGERLASRMPLRAARNHLPFSRIIIAAALFLIRISPY
jgi:hypothetical protein